MQIFLIRHPRPAVAAGICYGASDVPLADHPEVSATDLRARLPAGIAVVSSPLHRCLHLARQLHPVPRVDSRLAEMNFGAWEMSHWDDIGRDAIDAWAADPAGFAPPGGESARAVRDRAIACVEELSREDLEQVALVTHGGVIRVLHADVLGLPEDRWCEIQCGFGKFVTIEWRTSA